MYQNPDTGYWYDDDGNRISSEVLDSMQPADTYVTLPGGPTYLGETINGQQYAYVSQFANNGATPEASTQIELDYLAKFGVKPIWDAVKGWLAPVDANYAAAHPIQNSSSIFDLGPIFLAAAAVGGGLFTGAYDLGAAAAGESLLTAGAPDVIAQGVDEALGSSLSGSELAGAAVSAPIVDVPGLDLGVNPGGLDGALGDSAANYSAGMGADNILTAAPGVGVSILDSVPGAVRTAAGSLASTAGKALATGAIGKLLQSLAPSQPGYVPAGGYSVQAPASKTNLFVIAAGVLGMLGLLVAVHKKAS